MNHERPVKAPKKEVRLITKRGVKYVRFPNYRTSEIIEIKWEKCND